jgi:hypothetical protein
MGHERCLRSQNKHPFPEIDTDTIPQLGHISYFAFSNSQCDDRWDTKTVRRVYSCFIMFLESAPMPNPVLGFASIAVQLRGKSLSAMPPGANDGIRLGMQLLPHPSLDFSPAVLQF